MPESSPLAAEPPRTTSRDKSLGLNSTESEILRRLAAHGELAREQLYGLPISGHRTLRLGSIDPVIGALRKKLAENGLTLTTIRAFGWSLPLKDRKRIVELIRPRAENSFSNRCENQQAGV
jgi:DNA-binding response OmpR family regulator